MGCPSPSENCRRCKLLTTSLSPPASFSGHHGGPRQAVTSAFSRSSSSAGDSITFPHSWGRHGLVSVPGLTNGHLSESSQPLWPGLTHHCLKPAGPIPGVRVAETWTRLFPRGFGHQPEGEKHPQEEAVPEAQHTSPGLCPFRRQSSLETSPRQALEAFLLQQSVLSLKLKRPG